jgi:hypothetical protein
MTDDKGIEKLLSDLHCGSGQWKNIQHIVRFAFQSCFSKVNEQEIRFEALTKEMSNIFVEYAFVINQEDIYYFMLKSCNTHFEIKW